MVWVGPHLVDSESQEEGGQLCPFPNEKMFEFKGGLGWHYSGVVIKGRHWKKLAYTETNTDPPMQCQQILLIAPQFGNEPPSPPEKEDIQRHVESCRHWKGSATRVHAQ